MRLFISLSQNWHFFFELMIKIENEYSLKIWTSKWHRNWDNAGSMSLTLSAGGAGFLLRHKFDINQTMFRKNEIYCEKKSRKSIEMSMGIEQDKQTEWNKRMNEMNVFNIPVDPFVRFPTKLRLCCASRLRLVWVIHHQRCYPMPRPIVLPHLSSPTSANWRISVWHRPWLLSLFDPMFPMRCLSVPMLPRIAIPSCWPINKMKWNPIIVIKCNSNDLNEQQMSKNQMKRLPVRFQKFNTNRHNAMWNKAVNWWITFLT